LFTSNIVYATGFTAPVVNSFLPPARQVLRLRQSGTENTTYHSCLPVGAVAIVYDILQPGYANRGRHGPWLLTVQVSRNQFCFLPCKHRYRSKLCRGADTNSLPSLSVCNWLYCHWPIVQANHQLMRSTQCCLCLKQATGEGARQQPLFGFRPINTALRRIKPRRGGYGPVRQLVIAQTLPRPNAPALIGGAE